MRSLVLTIAALAASLVVLAVAPGPVSLAQTQVQLRPPGLPLPPGTEWLWLSDRAAIVITKGVARDSSVQGRLLVEVDGEWQPVAMNGFRALPLQ